MDLPTLFGTWTRAHVTHRDIVTQNRTLAKIVLSPGPPTACPASTKPSFCCTLSTKPSTTKPPLQNVPQFAKRRIDSSPVENKRKNPILHRARFCLFFPFFSPAVKALRSTSAQPSRVTTSLNLDTNHSPRTTPQRTTPQRTTTHYAIPQQRAQSNKKKLENKASGLPPFAQPNLLPRPPDI